MSNDADLEGIVETNKSINNRRAHSQLVCVAKQLMNLIKCMHCDLAAYKLNRMCRF